MSDDLSGFADAWFDEGAITFETGANAGRTIEVKSWTQGIRRLELWAPAGLPVEVGDQLRIYPGCHKRVLEDCRDRFRLPGSLMFDKGNARNFRGEPQPAHGGAGGSELMPSELTSTIGRFGLIAASVRSARRPARCSAGSCSARADRRSRGRALAASRSARAPMAA